MLRIIDMTEAKCADEFEFAVWDTVTDSFLKDVFDEQVWTREEFIQACADDYQLSCRKDRVLGLLPDNAPAQREFGEADCCDLTQRKGDDHGNV